MSFSPWCCFVGEDGACAQDAAWVIYAGPTVDDYTHACADHVDDLGGDQPGAIVVPMETK